MKLISGKKYAAKELAAQFGCNIKTIQNHANILFGKAEKGVARYFDEAQTTAILEHIKKPSSSGTKANLETEIRGTETALSPILQLKALQDQMNGIYEAEIARLKSDNKSLAADLKSTKSLLSKRTRGLATIQRIAEGAGLVLTDRDGLCSAYRGRK